MSSLSSFENRNLNWVTPIRLMEEKFVLGRSAVYQPLRGVVPKVIALAILAGAWKSAAEIAMALPNAPVRTSTSKLPWVLNGFVPIIFCCLIFKLTLLITAFAGMDDVVNDKIARYCLSVASSPRLMTEAVLLKVPPRLLVSLDSNIQPS
jgi:hypothetical protein